MKVFIDTNIFYDHWFLKGPSFQILSKFIKLNKQYELLISDVVRLEVENKYNEELNTISKQLKAANMKIRGLLGEDKLNISGLESNYNFEEILIQNFPDVQIIPFDSVNHVDLIEKAMKSIKPFNSSEKGYRDALIWHSFLDYLIKHKITCDIVFITTNIGDFFNGKELELHPDLQKDLEKLNLSNKFILHTKLKDFTDFLDVDQEVEDIQLVSVEPADSYLEEIILDYIDENESEFENLAITSIENFSVQAVLKIFRTSLAQYNNFLHLIKDFEFEVMDGIEDLYLESWKKLDVNKIVFDCSFDLRGSVFKFILNTKDYILNEHEINEGFYNIKITEDDTEIYWFGRSFVLASAIFDVENKIIKSIDFSFSVE